MITSIKYLTEPKTNMQVKHCLFLRGLLDRNSEGQLIKPKAFLANPGTEGKVKKSTLADIHQAKPLRNYRDVKHRESRNGQKQTTHDSKILLSKKHLR